MTEEVHALRISLDKFGTREQRRAVEKQEREELLSRADTGRLAKQEMDAEAQVGKDNVLDFTCNPFFRDEVGVLNVVL